MKGASAKVATYGVSKSRTHFGLSPADFRALRALKTPRKVQQFIDALTYD